MIRYSKDTQKHEYFGYEVLADPIPQTGMYRVTFSALTFEDLGVGHSEWRMLPAPFFPPPQIVGSADTIAVNVFESPVTGQKIVDYLRIRRDNCDSQTGPGHVACLNGLITDARRSLTERLKQFEGGDAGQALAVKDSQEAWEKYREQACAGLKDEAKRLQCELTLLRNSRARARPKSTEPLAPATPYPAAHSSFCRHQSPVRHSPTHTPSLPTTDLDFQTWPDREFSRDRR